jgi:hypothetical protein
MQQQQQQQQHHHLLHNHHHHLPQQQQQQQQQHQQHHQEQQLHHHQQRPSNSSVPSSSFYRANRPVDLNLINIDESRGLFYNNQQVHSAQPFLHTSSEIFSYTNNQHVPSTLTSQIHHSSYEPHHQLNHLTHHTNIDHNNNSNSNNYQQHNQYSQSTNYIHSAPIMNSENNFDFLNTSSYHQADIAISHPSIHNTNFTKPLLDHDHYLTELEPQPQQQPQPQSLPPLPSTTPINDGKTNESSQNSVYSPCCSSAHIINQNEHQYFNYDLIEKDSNNNNNQMDQQQFSSQYSSSSNDILPSTTTTTTDNITSSTSSPAITTTKPKHQFQLYQNDRIYHNNNTNVNRNIPSSAKPILMNYSTLTNHFSFNDIDLLPHSHSVPNSPLLQPVVDTVDTLRQQQHQFNSTSSNHNDGIVLESITDDDDDIINSSLAEDLIAEPLYGENDVDMVEQVMNDFLENENINNKTNVKNENDNNTNNDDSILKTTPPQLSTSTKPTLTTEDKSDISSENSNIKDIAATSVENLTLIDKVSSKLSELSQIDETIVHHKQESFTLNITDPKKEDGLNNPLALKDRKKKAKKQNLKNLFQNDFESDNNNNNSDADYEFYNNNDNIHNKRKGDKHSQMCIDCHKVFTNKSALAKHRLIHSNDRKYNCHICEKAFKRQDHLNGHMLTHQDKKPFQCRAPNCDKSYCDSRSLKRHVESQHQNILIKVAQGDNEALNYLPKIGKLKTNIGPNIEKEIDVNQMNEKNRIAFPYSPITPVPGQINENNKNDAEILSQTFFT